MTILVTGAAGFIGYHVAEALLARGERVLGVDDLNAYYDVRLKMARLARLQRQKDFSFVRLDIAEGEKLARAVVDARNVDRIVHLAAQAGVRHSLDDPFAYARSNVTGQLSVLEVARHTSGLRHLVYASSSSVYGASRELPFCEDDRADTPLSLYAATKRSGELMGYAYAHLFRIPMTGLRFFTVYGPWGRPDMAYFSFAEAISRAGRSPSMMAARCGAISRSSTTWWRACWAVWTIRRRTRAPTRRQGCSTSAIRIARR